MHTNWAYRLDCLTDSDAARGWKAHFDNAFLRAKQSAQENLESSSPGIILADKLNTKPFFPSIVKCFSVLDHSSEPAFRRDPVLCSALSNHEYPLCLAFVIAPHQNPVTAVSLADLCERLSRQGIGCQVYVSYSALF